MDRLRQSIVFTLLALSGLLPQHAASAEESRLRIVSPDGSVPALGQLDVTVEILSREVVLEVSLFVDGLPAGERTQPPYVFPIDFGQENLSHRIEARAHLASDETLVASVVTPSYRVDEVIDLALQQVYVTVTDRQGHRILDLDQDDFRLLDNGRPQRIVTFAGGEIPFSALLLLDGSESMLGRQIDAARAGARAFLSGMSEFDEAKVMVFSTRLLAASDFSGPDVPLDRMIEEVVPDGGTSINDFLYLGLQRLEQRSGRRVLVLLSDGWDVHSILRMEQVAGAARQSQAQIYWLRLHDGSDDFVNLVNSWREPPTNRKQMKRLERTIRESGGRILSVSRPDEIETSFREVLAELREQYALGYYPDQRFDDGRWRRLEVEVTGRYKVKAREGYLDLP